MPIDLQADGLLWLINKAALHPRGFALGYDKETHEFVLIGDGTEPWQFADPIDDEMFPLIEAALARARVENKQASL